MNALIKEKIENAFNELNIPRQIEHRHRAN